MKAKISVAVLFSLILNISNGQTQSVGQKFTFNAAIPVKSVRMMNLFTTNRYVLPKDPTVNSGVIYVISTIRDQEIEFYALPYSPLKDKDVNRGTVKDLAYLYNDIVFTISKSDFISSTKDFTPIDRVNIGVLTLPYKLRPQKNTSYEAAFNLDATVGFYIFQKGDANIYIQGGAGISTVGLNSTNAKGLEHDQAQNISAFTAFTGLMLQYRSIQTGIYLGGDWINNNEKYQWDHQGKIWLSLGVGFKIFTLSEKEKN